jgi:hypothetical protein
MVVSQNDVASSVVVQPINQGQSLGQPTLDLCNGTYPSESLRTARLQVLAVDGGGNALLSTEAVLYNNPASATQGFSELASTASKCPSTPVNGVTTHFNAAPDGSWPQVAGVQRQAYDFTSTDQTGQNQHSVAVYLRRGRALLGVYFSQPDGAQSSVAGQTTIPTILNVFANRLAALPAGAIGA